MTIWTVFYIQAAICGAALVALGFMFRVYVKALRKALADNPQ